MPETTVETRDVLEAVEVSGRRKKARFPSQWGSTTTAHQRTLELEGVIEVLREYDSVEGNDINCSICGKDIFFSRFVILVWLFWCRKSHKSHIRRR